MPLGDYSVGVPPLPIPNREVKPDSADGTAIVGEQVVADFKQKGVPKRNALSYFNDIVGEGG